MEFPEDLLYTKEHEWVRKEDDGHIIVGITDYAQDSLGDIVFVELPEEGDHIIKDDAFGIVESVKAVSDIYAPVTGHVVEVNEKLLDAPARINDDPYHDGWMLKIAPENEDELDDLITVETYEHFVGTSHEDEAGEEGVITSEDEKLDL